MWTAGVNVCAGFHNHVEASFCEIHACIVNGIGKGAMSWATFPDDNLNPADPDPAQYDCIVVGDMHEHGPLWRTGEDGIPQFRENGTVDYIWQGKRKWVLDCERCSLVRFPTAWITGEGDPEHQVFDVWLAFEFPPLVSKLPKETASLLPPGTHRTVNPMFLLGTEVEGGDSNDGTLIVLGRQNPGRQQRVGNRDVLLSVLALPRAKSFPAHSGGSPSLLKLSTITCKMWLAGHSCRPTGLRSRDKLLWAVAPQRFSGLPRLGQLPPTEMGCTRKSLFLLRILPALMARCQNLADRDESRLDAPPEL